MPRLRVEQQEFLFADGWQAIKYDDEAFRKEKLGDDEAVDIVALSPRGTLYFIEVKDYRGPERSQVHRALVSSGELFVKIGRKVRFTVAGLIGGGVRWHDSHPHLRPFAEALADPACEIHVVAWIENDYQGLRDPARARLTSGTDLFKKHVRWLRARALVTSSQAPAPIVGLTVSD